MVVHRLLHMQQKGSKQQQHHQKDHTDHTELSSHESAELREEDLRAKSGGDGMKSRRHDTNNDNDNDNEHERNSSKSRPHRHPRRHHDFARTGAAAAGIHYCSRLLGKEARASERVPAHAATVAPSQLLVTVSFPASDPTFDAVFHRTLPPNR